MKIDTYSKQRFCGIGIAYVRHDAVNFMSLRKYNKNNTYIHMHSLEFVFIKWVIAFNWDRSNERP